MNLSFDLTAMGSAYADMGDFARGIEYQEKRFVAGERGGSQSG